MSYTPRQLRAILAQDICPFCGRGPFRALARHVPWCPSPNAVPVRVLKEMAGLPKTVPLVSPELSAKWSQTAIDRGLKPVNPAPPHSGWTTSDFTKETHWHTANADDVHRFVSGAPHGHRQGYTNWNCRCGACRKAHADYRRLLNQKRRGDRPVPIDRHGLADTYGNYGCRCDACSEANRLKCRQNKVDRRTSWRDGAEL